MEIRTRFTTTGKIYLTLTLLFFVASMNASNNLLYLVTALMSAYFICSLYLGTRNLSSVSIMVELPDEVYANTACAANVVVKNENNHDVFILEIRINGSTVIFPYVCRHGAAQKSISIIFSQRGITRLNYIKLSSVYPWGLFEYRSTIDVGSATVFPKLAVCNVKTVVAKNEHTCILSDFSSDIAGVRNYSNGDSMRNIHWKSSARTGKLKSKLFERNNDASLSNVIELDKLLVKDGKELALSRAAFVIKTVFEAGDSIGIRSKGKFFMPKTGRQNMLLLLNYLATFDEK